MTNHRLFLWIGGALIILPFLGIPESWKHLIMFIIALSLISIALIIRSNEQSSHSRHDEPVFEDNVTPEAFVPAHEDVAVSVPDAPEPTYEVHVFEESHMQVVEDVLPPKSKKPRKKRVVKEEPEEVVANTPETFDEYVQ